MVGFISWLEWLPQLEVFISTVEMYSLGSRVERHRYKNLSWKKIIINSGRCRDNWYIHCAKSHFRTYWKKNWTEKWYISNKVWKLISSTVRQKKQRVKHMATIRRPLSHLENTGYSLTTLKSIDSLLNND